MGKDSKISWTDGTLNFWEGCTKISEGCTHCYAEARDIRYSAGAHWGKGAPRKKSVSALTNCFRLNKKAEKGDFIRCHSCGARHWRGDKLHAENCGGLTGDPVRPIMFVMSLSDFGDAEVDPEWRAEALDAMLRCDAMDYMVLSKRPGLYRELIQAASLKMTPTMRHRITDWLDYGDVPKNIAMGATVESKKTAEGRLHDLADFPAVRRFISAEPLLSGGWSKLLDGYPVGTFHLVIPGGESGTGARPMHPAWALELEAAADRNLIAYHFKQWGEWVSPGIVPFQTGKPAAGNLVVVTYDGKVQAFDPPILPKTPAPTGPTVVWRAGKHASGHACDHTGRTRTERLVYPLQPWKERWFHVDTCQRPLPSLAAAAEWQAVHGGILTPLETHPVG